MARLQIPAVFLAVAAFDLPAAMPSPAKAFIETNCASCHRTAKAPAGLDLAAADFDLNDPTDFGRWVRIYDAVQSKAMPPAGNAVPDAERAKFLNAIRRPMIAHEQRHAATAGRAVMRRLNRYEYENTVRDLLAAPWLQLRDSLPEDGILNRFNKSGQALDVSHVQMSRYIETAESALRSVLSAAKYPQQTKRYYAREQRRLINRMRYTPFNRHPERASIPILGFEAQPDVLAETAPMTVGASDPKTRDLEGFATPAGNYVGNEHHFDQFAAPVGGKYRIRLNAFSIWIHTNYGNEGHRLVYYRPNRHKTSRGRTTEPLTIYALSKGGGKRLLGSFDLTPEPALHDLDVYLLPGEQILPDPARLFRSRPGFIGSPDATADGMPGVAYRWMDVTGPVDDTASQESLRRLFGNLPATRDAEGDTVKVVSSGDGEAERLLRAFMGRAYRRPPLEAEVRRYLAIIEERRESGFEEAMIAGYTAVLCSPGFLYLEEKPGPLDSWALASRLSYFLWNAPPDQQLRDLAAKGLLLRPAVLRAQTERLLDDPRSRQFNDAFLDYWLDLRKLNDTTPDVTLYPDYYLDDLLTESAVQETQLFFSHLVRKNLPAGNIVQSNFTFLNSHLARHYGLPPVEGVVMRPVTLPDGSVRGGLLTQASVLKVTANGTTTSPVLRGVWILERILGETLPPPPAGTPAIEPDTRGATTIRQQLDKHRSVASCAVCHTKIDPPGFALESFDILGGWRDRYRSTDQGEPVKGIGKNGHEFTFRLSQPVDSTGELRNGQKFRDVIELKRLLAGDERQIARNMLTQLITYATGASVSFGDRVEAESILDAAKADHYGMRTLIEHIVQSRLFTQK